MILWMISVVVLFNCIVSPLLSPVWKMPTIELPEWYSSLAGTIIVGLFTKKAFDGNAINIGNLFSKPAKGSETHVESEHRTVVAPSTQEAAPAPAAEKTTPAKEKDSAPAKPKPEPTEYLILEYQMKRYKSILKKRLIIQVLVADRKSVV